MGQIWHLFVCFGRFLNVITNIVQQLTTNGRSVDGVHGIRAWDCRIVGTDESTELW